jgi:hypothetical protein
MCEELMKFQGEDRLVHRSEDIDFAFSLMSREVQIIHGDSKDRKQWYKFGNLIQECTSFTGLQLQGTFWERIEWILDFIEENTIQPFFSLECFYCKNDVKYMVSEQVFFHQLTPMSLDDNMRSPLSPKIDWFCARLEFSSPKMEGRIWTRDSFMGMIASTADGKLKSFLREFDTPARAIM